MNIIIDAKEEFHLIDRIIKITLKITKNNSIEKLKYEWITYKYIKIKKLTI